MKQLLYFAMALLIGASSCTKTEYTDYEAETANRILEYKVSEAKINLLGAIDNENNTITVYIPYYASIEYLNATIKLDEGAILLDSTGKEINLDGGLDPIKVDPDGPSYKYTVVPVTGEKRTYTVIQKILPNGTALEVKYTQLAEGQTMLIRPANTLLIITGNFESSSTNAKFYLINKVTGQVHDDFIVPMTMIPGDNGYTFTTYTSPYALAGDYTVRMEHMGRSTDLPDLKLYYARYPYAATSFSSTASYAPGDTIKFPVAIGSADNINPANIYLSIERMYIKVRSNDAFPRTGSSKFVVPDTFPESMFEKEFEMKIINQDRTQITAIFPDMPVGQYTGSQAKLSTVTDEFSFRRTKRTDVNFGFYVDYTDDSGWDKGEILAYPSSIRFTVNEKK